MEEAVIARDVEHAARATRAANDRALTAVLLTGVATNQVMHKRSTRPLVMCYTSQRNTVVTLPIEWTKGSVP